MRFDGLQRFLELTPQGSIHSCMSGQVDETCFTIFIVVSAACLEGTAPWPILMARDSASGFTFHLAADLRSGEPCYFLSFGAGSKTTPISIDLWQPHLLVLRKDKQTVRWWLDGDELDAIPSSSFFADENSEDSVPNTEAEPGRLAAGTEPCGQPIKFDSILLGRSVVELEGAIPGAPRDGKTQMATRQPPRFLKLAPGSGL